MSLVDRVKSWAEKNIAFIFSVLRFIKPNLAFKGFGLISRFDDVQEALSRPNIFGVTYAQKMGVITNGSNFFLGMNNTPEYTRDVSNMRLAVRRSDIDSIVAPLVEKLSQEIVSASNGEMDVVQELSQVVPAQFTASYIGVPGPDQEQLIAWATCMFQYLFYPELPPEIEEQATLYAAKAREHIDELIQNRKSSNLDTDDIIKRCLELQNANTPGMDDETIRNNLIGIIIGLIPTTSKCVALTMDYLLDHPDLLAGAQPAAKADDTATIRQYVYESLRFNSFGAGLFREVLEDYTIARGTLHRKTFRKGTQVLVATQSAMLDARQLRKPKAFKLDRPDYHYMHFGYGMHTCFGEYINGVQIPIIVKALLQCEGLERLPGERGETEFQGPFPNHLRVRFSPRQ